MKKNTKDKNIAEVGGTASATAGGLGTGFVVCHTICQSLISVLAILGVTILGMPLAFLEPYSVPLLVLAAASFGFSIWMCKKHSLPIRTLLKPIGIGLLVAAIIIFSVFLVNAYTMIDLPRDQAQIKSAQQPLDKCLPPSGYTEESWREHMSHHPDIYADCLK
ncbi:hypothetical protein HYZ41_00485 [archaeon]|nr:hypothetical protein [archaeon]